MLIIKQAALLQSIIQHQREQGRSIGFVPTMGALHAGHLSLVGQSKAQNAVSICSIFVNPTQFNEASDLDKYPRTPETDIKALERIACDILFMPSVEEVYPTDLNNTVEVDLAGLDVVMEGAFRPGHFQGVVQVVSRLLDLTTPDRLYMGQKDYQQLAIIRHMILEQRRSVELIMGSTIREEDGLAMSSRNVRLSPAFRSKASLIHQRLQQAKATLFSKNIPEIEAEAIEVLSDMGFRPEYFSIVDGLTLQAIKDPNDHESIVACVAAWAGEVRLIDNLILR